jgi:hypothetical protein
MADTAEDRAERLHPAAVALSAFRILPNGIEGRAYTISEAPSGRAAIERALRQAKALGYVTDASKESYAVLDVLDVDDSIVQDFGIPDAKAFRWWKRLLHLHVAEGSA